MYRCLRAKNTNKLLPRNFLPRESIIKLHLASWCLGCIVLFHFFGERTRSPHNGYPIIIFRYSFASFLSIPRLLLPSFSVISCLSLLCDSLLAAQKEVCTLQNLSHGIHHDAIRSLLPYLAPKYSWLNEYRMRKINQCTLIRLNNLTTHVWCSFSILDPRRYKFRFGWFPSHVAYN